jgi:hypothetical protein
MMFYAIVFLLLLFVTARSPFPPCLPLKSSVIRSPLFPSDGHVSCFSMLLLSVQTHAHTRLESFVCLAEVSSHFSHLPLFCFMFNNTWWILSPAISIIPAFKATSNVTWHGRSDMEVHFDSRAKCPINTTMISFVLKCRCYCAFILTMVSQEGVAEAKCVFLKWRQWSLPASTRCLLVSCLVSPTEEASSGSSPLLQVTGDWTPGHRGVRWVSYQGSSVFLLDDCHFLFFTSEGFFLLQLQEVLFLSPASQMLPMSLIWGGSIQKAVCLAFPICLYRKLAVPPWLTLTNGMGGEVRTEDRE